MTATLLDKFLTISNLFQEDMARAFAGTPLTEARVAVLWTLAAQGPSTQQALAEALSVTPRNISGLVDALESHDYVQRTAHPTDRRAFLVALTSAGEKAMARMQEEHTQLNAELRDAVTPEQHRALEEGIDAIIARLTALMTEAQASKVSKK